MNIREFDFGTLYGHLNNILNLLKMDDRFQEIILFYFIYRCEIIARGEIISLTATLVIVFFLVFGLVCISLDM